MKIIQLMGMQGTDGVADAKGEQWGENWNQVIYALMDTGDVYVQRAAVGQDICKWEYAFSARHIVAEAGNPDGSRA